MYKNLIPILILLLSGTIYAQPPAITISGPSNVNPGDQATYTASFNYVNGPITWTVTGGVITTPPTNTSCDVWWNPTTGKGSVRAVDANNHVTGNLFVWRGLRELVLCPLADAGPDITICAGNPAMIGTPGVPDFKYAWWPETGLNDPSLPQPTVTTNFARRYTVTVTAQDNLIVNGDFEMGYTGFITDYGIFPNGIGCPGNDVFGSIQITPNPYLFVGTQYCESTDHTPNGTNMLFVDGTCTPNRRVWSQTVNVTPNSVYYFSGYAANASDRQYFIVEWAANLRVRINGVNVLQGFNNLWSCNNWQEIAAQWNSGSSTTATIEIFDDNLATDLNDFALDDLYFGLCPRSSDQMLVSTGLATAVTPTGPITYYNQYETPQSVVLTCSPGFNYQWYRNGASIAGATGSTYTVPLSGLGNIFWDYYCINSCGTSNTVRIYYKGCMSSSQNCYPVPIPSYPGPCLQPMTGPLGYYPLPAAPSLGPGTVNNWWLYQPANGFPSCYTVDANTGHLQSPNGISCQEGIYTKASLNGAETIMFYYFAANPACRISNPGELLQPVSGMTPGALPLSRTNLGTTISTARLAPNPANSTVTVTAATGIMKVALYNQSGVLVRQVTGNGSRNMVLDTGKLPNGIYICKIFGEKQHEVLKLIIQR